MSVAASRPTIEGLLACVYRHYPRGIESGDPRHHDTEEPRRLACVHEAAAIACGKQYFPVADDERMAIDEEVRAVIDALRAWPAFGKRCHEAFPDCLVWDESGPFFDPGYRFSVSTPGRGVHPSRVPDDWRDPVLCAVSMLAPVYVIYTYDSMPDGFTQIRYSSFPERYLDRISKLSALAEEYFGFHRLSEDTMRTRVPDVAPFGANRSMNETTLADCLFSSHL